MVGRVEPLWRSIGAVPLDAVVRLGTKVGADFQKSIENSFFSSTCMIHHLILPWMI